MICSRCGKNQAQKYMLQGKEIFLCADCRREEGARREVCPECGTSLSDFRKTGLAGCAYCYTAFRAEVLVMLGKMQDGTRHTGKVQSTQSLDNYEETRELVREHDYVKAKLERALSSGDFDGADLLTAQLEALNKKLYPEVKK